MRRLGERRLDRRLVAIGPVQRQVVRRVGPDRRRIGLRARAPRRRPPAAASRSSSTRSAASSACCGVFATTIATASPTWRTRPVASTGIGAATIGLPSRPGNAEAGGMPPRPSAATSAPEKTPSTPGMARAAPVSIPRSSACPTGARTKTAWAWPSRFTSSVNRAWPVIRTSSSRRQRSAPPKRIRDRPCRLPLGCRRRDTFGRAYPGENLRCALATRSAVADYTYVIASGRLVFEGPPAALARDEAILDAHRVRPERSSPRAASVELEPSAAVRLTLQGVCPASGAIRPTGPQFSRIFLPLRITFLPALIVASPAPSITMSLPLIVTVPSFLSVMLAAPP